MNFIVSYNQVHRAAFYQKLINGSLTRTDVFAEIVCQAIDSSSNISYRDKELGKLIISTLNDNKHF